MSGELRLVIDNLIMVLFLARWCDICLNSRLGYNCHRQWVYSNREWDRKCRSFLGHPRTRILIWRLYAIRIQTPSSETVFSGNIVCPANSLEQMITLENAYWSNVGEKLKSMLIFSTAWEALLPYVFFLWDILWHLLYVVASHHCTCTMGLRAKGGQISNPSSIWVSSISVRSFDAAHL